MLKSNFVPKIPYGTKDFLINEAKEKRLMETTLADFFAQWGYKEVVTPTFEYMEIFDSSSSSEQVFKFFDREGNTLVLRPDMTVPIARLACTRLKDVPRPTRLCYIANVFRYEQAQAGRQCEFYQAGIELLGTSLPTADAEIVALAVESIEKIGLDDFKISLGHVGFLNGIIENSGLNDDQKQSVRMFLSNKDLVGLEEYIQDINIKESVKTALKEILFLHGGKDLLEKARKLADNPLSAQALDNLTAIYSMLEEYGVAQKVSFDLGLIRDISYYTGMVFEAYTEALGFPVCGGGRYDKMMSSFGEQSPSIGFSVGIDRLLMALAKKEQTNGANNAIYIAWSKNAFNQAVAKARQLRQEGKIVHMAFASQSKDEAQQTANGKKLIYVGS